MSGCAGSAPEGRGHNFLHACQLPGPGVGTRGTAYLGARPFHQLLVSNVESSHLPNSVELFLFLFIYLL